MKKNNQLQEIGKILSGSDAPQDQAGNTTLTLLADKIKLLPVESRMRQKYIQAIRSCAGLLEKFSLKEIERLCKLINFIELSYKEYAFIFSAAFKEWKPTPKNITKRAEIFRLICESGMYIDVDFISNEKEIRDKCPWHWIDAAVYVDWRLAKIVIKVWLKKNKNVAPVMQRLSHWRDLHKDKASFQKTLAEILQDVRLKEKDKKTMELFLEAL